MQALRVLVVDDEVGMRTGAARVLARESFHCREAGDDNLFHYEVEQAPNGEQALAKISSFRPDILLLDIRLPGISGMEVLAEVSGKDPDLLTVMMTAYPTIDTAVMATRAGCFDFLAKPFTPSELAAAVHKASKHIVLRQKARLHAEEKRRIRFEFISVLAHELQAPLAAVEGSLLDMQDRAFGDALDAYEALIGGGLLRIRGMRKLVSDLLDLTRLESGMRRRELEPVEVTGVARQVLETLASEAVAHQVALIFEPRGPVTMVADRTELELIFANILTNAIKYNREGGSVELVVAARDGRVVIKASDTGIGMSAADVARVFHEFVRIKSDKTRLIPGSGLGLSTVRKVAMLYDGDATLVSTPEIGTTIEVVLCDKNVAR